MNRKMLYILLACAVLLGASRIFSQSLVKTNSNNSFPGFNRMPLTKEDLTSRRKWEFMRLRDPYTNTIPANISTLERLYAKNLPNDKMMRLQKGTQIVNSNPWTYRGPYNQGGRSRALAVDVNNPNIILSGGATGGMWRSTDNGQSWVKVTPAQDTVQTVTCIVQDTRSGKTNNWYYGTGEYASNLELPDNGAGFVTFLGGGVYKSTDDGITWSRLSSTSSGYVPTLVNRFQIVWNIAVDTSNMSQDIVYAAVLDGIYRSSDGGANWSLVLSDRDTANTNLSIYSNVAVTSHGDVYAALSNGKSQGIWHSTDGINWTDITPTAMPAAYGRIVIASAPTNTNVLYVLANTPGSGNSGSPDNGTGDYHTLLKYSASSNQWTDLTNSLPAWSGNVGGYSSQNGYDMVIKVSPADSNFVIIGGTNLYRTTDGFATKLDSTNWVGGYSTNNDVSSYTNQHPDEHDLYYLPSNPKIVYSANDGGLSYTTDITANPVNWTSINNGFSTTQFYSVALDHATANSPLIVGGMQDNGNMMDTTLTGNSSWIVLPYGGDGCISAVADSGNYIYFATQNGNIMEARLSDQQGALIKPAGATGYLFVTPYVLDPANTNIMYLAAGTNIWRNTNLLSIPIGTDSATSTNWTDFSSFDTTANVTALAVSTQPAHVLYYGTDGGTVFKVLNADQGIPTSQNITSNTFPSGFVSSIAVDPQNANNVLVAFSNYNILSIFSTTDGGVSWNAVSGNLEQNPDGSGNGPSVRSVRILNLNGSKIYYAGTSTGLYAATTLNGMSTTWVQQGTDNIGMIDAETIDTRDLDGTVAVGTFGNGVYSTQFSITGIQEVKNIPQTYSLLQNYPNPFNPTTTITYQLPKTENIKLNIYNILGEEVKTLIDRNESAGVYHVKFDGSNFASGVYFYRLQAGNFIATKKLILLK